ncbi:MAG: galactosyldiacylglycerol synthase, partial [Hydrogeniiclostridium mannosilyticum]
MTERGAAAEQVYPFGIPVRAAFLQKEEKKAARRQLGLSENLPVVLIMAGSFGVKKSLGLYEHLAAAELPVQFVVITGNNEALRQGFTEAAAHYP